MLHSAYFEIFSGLLSPVRRISSLVYTVNVGHYDFSIQGRPRSSIPHFYLSDSDFAPKGWIPLRFNREMIADAWLLSRFFKVFPSIIFPDAVSSLYVDSSFVFIHKPEEIFREYGEHPLVLFTHPTRTNVFQEIVACRDQKKARLIDLIRFEQKIKNLGLGATEGLYSGGFIIRKHSAEVEECMYRWWDLMETSPKRDQLTLPFALTYSKIDFFAINKNIFFNTIAIPAPHRKHKAIRFIIFFIKLCVLTVKYRVNKLEKLFL